MICNFVISSIQDTPILHTQDNDRAIKYQEVHYVGNFNNIPPFVCWLLARAMECWIHLIPLDLRS